MRLRVHVLRVDDKSALIEQGPVKHIERQIQNAITESSCYNRTRDICKSQIKKMDHYFALAPSKKVTDQLLILFGELYQNVALYDHRKNLIKKISQLVISLSLRRTVALARILYNQFDNESELDFLNLKLRCLQLEYEFEMDKPDIEIIIAICKTYSKEMT
jgi:hypothetical protein